MFKDIRFVFNLGFFGVWRFSHKNRFLKTIMDKRQIIIMGSRNTGKTRLAVKMLEKFLDENPNGIVCVTKANGEHEFTENAEFEVVEQKKLESGE